MKTLTLLVIAALIGASYQQDNLDLVKLRQHADECVKEVGGDPELIKKSLQTGEFTDNNNLKCFIKCVYQKLGYMDASGKIDVTAMVNYVPPEVDKAKASEIVTKCSQVKGDDACQLAFDFLKCIGDSWKQMKSN